MRALEVNPRQQLMAFVRTHRTQVEAAAALGVSPSFLGDMLRGGRAVTVPVLAHLGLRRAVVRDRTR